MNLFEFGNNTDKVRFSGLDDGNLEKILEAIIIISKIKDKNDALENVDKFVFQILNHISEENQSSIDEDNDYEKEQIENALEEIEDFKKEMKKIHKRIKDLSIDEYDIDTLEDASEEFGDNWSKNIKKILKKEIEELKEMAKSLAEITRKKFHIQNIENSLTENIYSISSVERIIRELEEAEKYIKDNKLLTDDLIQKIRKGRERSVWFRAKKKLDEADVAEGGQNIKKAEKLRGEAKILIKQDWGRAFPNEEAPEIS